MELSELKEQNAKEEADNLAAESIEETTSETAVVEDDAETSETTVEPWMQEEEAEEQTSEDPSKSVPVGKFVSLKKELRGKIEDRDKELEKLRSENEALRLAKPKEEPTLKRPVAKDFNSDEEYELALSKYDEDRLQDTYNRNRKKEQQEAEQRQAQEAINNAMFDHSLRYVKAMEEAGIPEKKYVSVSKNTEVLFDDIFGVGGDAVYKNIFAKLGKGSEKLEYFIGVNRSAQDKVRSLIKDDPLGISLAMWLGQEKQRLTNPIKPRSNAPDPATSVKGEVPTGSAGKFKKKYDSAKSPQEAYDIKKAAKAAKVDVSSW